MAGQLDDGLVARVTELCDRGDDAVERERFDEALLFYEEALSLVPAPRYSWRITAWILTALGDAHFFRKDYEAARGALAEAMRCPDASGSPFVHLRLGQVELELGNARAARDELCRAYRRAGEAIFAGEAEKYWDLIKDALPDDDEPALA